CLRRARKSVAGVGAFMGGFKRNRFKMLSKRQRYQKTRLVSVGTVWERIRVSLAVGLALGLAGCTGSDRPSHAAAAQHETQGGGARAESPMDRHDVVQLASLKPVALERRDTVTIIPPP